MRDNRLAIRDPTRHMLQTDSKRGSTETDVTDWCLTIAGQVEDPISYDADDLCSLEQAEVRRDFSCVEGWSRSDLGWGGIWMDELIERSQPRSNARYALVYAFDEEYTCSFALDRLEDGFLALRLDGSPLALSDGGPARLVFRANESECWESVKRVSRIEVCFHEPEETARGIALSRLD